MITLSPIKAFVRDGDPFWLTIKTDNYELTDGKKAQVKVTCKKYFGSVDDVLSVEIPELNIAIVLKCKETPGASEFAPRNINESSIDYMNRVIVPALTGTIDLWDSFSCGSVSSGADNSATVTFTAREEKALSLSITHTGGSIIYGIPNQLHSSITTIGESPTYRDNFKINIRLTDTSGNFIINTHRKYSPNLVSRLEVDIKFLIKGLKKTSHFPVISGIMPDVTYAYDDSVIKIEYWESWAENGETKSSFISRTDKIRVVPGGTSKLELQKFNSTGTHWSDILAAKTILLSNISTDINLLPGQPFFVKYLSDFSGGILWIVIHNGSPYPRVLQKKPSGPGGSTIIHSDVSPKFLGLDTSVKKYQVYYEAYSATNTKISNFLNITIDRTPYQNIRFFVFENSLGGWDSIYGVGIGEVETELSRSRISRKALRKNFSWRDRESEVLEVDEEVTYKVNLGYYQYHSNNRINWANYIRQLYMSKRAFEYINGEYIPIDIVSKKQQLLKDDKYLQDYELEYKRAFVERNAPSEIPPLVGDYSDDYSDDYNK